MSIQNYENLIYKWINNLLIEIADNIDDSRCSDTEISNEYSELWVESNPTHNFWYLYAFIGIAAV